VRAPTIENLSVVGLPESLKAFRRLILSDGAARSIDDITPRSRAILNIVRD
jgi:hypothetical protein